MTELPEDTSSKKTSANKHYSAAVNTELYTSLILSIVDRRVEGLLDSTKVRNLLREFPLS